MSNLSAFALIQERSEATPGLWNNVFSTLSSNIAAVDSTLGLGRFQQLSIGSTPPSYLTTAAVTIEVNSNQSDYLYLVDSAAQRSSYIIGSRAGGTADGLNIWDVSAATMIASFSKQSIRFFQNVVGPVFDVGGALADTLNAATFGTGANSKESRIQAAISAATIANISRVYVPANMYPYSCASVSFDSRVQMVREGGDWGCYDVQAYGCKGDTIQNDTTGIQGAIDAAANNLRPSGIGGGAVVFLPTGSYKITSVLSVPVVTSSSIVLKGNGLRASYVYPFTAGQTAILFGANAPDLSGTYTNVTEFCGMEDMAVSGSALSPGTSIGVQLTEMQQGWMRNVLIERFDQTESIGLYLRGSTTGALGASAAPHCWRNEFHNVNIITCRRPLVLQNADENGFYNCDFGLQTGYASACTAIYWQQGQHNKFYNILCAGEVSSLTTGRPNYTGIAFTQPVLGNVLGLQVYGMWAEGFDKGIVFGGGNAQDAWVYGFQGASNRVFFDNGSENGGNERRNNVHIAIGGGSAAGGIPDFHDGIVLSTEPRVLSLNSATPNIAGGNTFYFGNNSNTSITDFLGGRRGQRISVLLDSFTSIIHGGNLFCPAAQNIVGEASLAVELDLIGLSSWYVTAVSPRRGPSLFYDGNSLRPAYAYSSEASLGWYRSTNSTMALSYGQLAVPFGTSSNPGICFSTDTDTGFYTPVGDALDFVAGGILSFRVQPNSARIETGTAILPALAPRSEISLGFYRSGASTLALSYGTFNLTASGAVTSIASLTIKSGTNNSCGTAVLGSNGSVNVANTYVKTGDLIFLTDQTPGGTLGDLEVGGIRNSSGFTIQSTSVTDTSTVGWLIVRPG